MSLPYSELLTQLHTYNVGLLDCNGMIFQALEQLYGKIGKKLKGEKVLQFNYSNRKGWFF